MRKAGGISSMATTKASGPMALERIRRGDYFFQVGGMGEAGHREVKVMAKTPGSPTMLVGIPETALIAWLLLDDPEEEGFPHPLSLERATAAFKPTSSGIRRLFEDAQKAQAEEEAEAEAKAQEEEKARAEAEAKAKAEAEADARRPAKKKAATKKGSTSGAPARNPTS